MRPALLIPLLLIVLLFCAPRVQGAPAPLRPYSGIGLLWLRPDPAGERLNLVLYREPGLERIAEPAASTLPRLAGSATEPVVAVAARKGAWALIAYDEAGREGWVEQPRSWDYRDWQEFLPGSEVWLLPGMKKSFYTLRAQPDDRGAERGQTGRDQRVRVLKAEGDWVLLEEPYGWLRWRDGDGRLTISLQDPQGREKR